jgi:hypothetical protein
VADIYKNFKVIQNGINDLMFRYNDLTKTLYNYSTFSEEDCINKLSLMKRKDELRSCLRTMGIDDFDMIDDVNKIHITFY